MLLLGLFYETEAGDVEDRLKEDCHSVSANCPSVASKLWVDMGVVLPGMLEESAH